MVNGSFSVVVVIVTWCDETENKKKGCGIGIYVYQTSKFKIRESIDTFNESVDTQSIEILNKKIMKDNYDRLGHS